MGTDWTTHDLQGLPLNGVGRPDIGDGRASLSAIGLCGIPGALIQAIAVTGSTNLEVFSNNYGVDGHGLRTLLSQSRIRRVTASYVR